LQPHEILVLKPVRSIELTQLKPGFAFVQPMHVIVFEPVLEAT
jgi:hypothetical protein